MRAEIWEARKERVQACATDGLTIAEAAERLGVTYATVCRYSRMFNIKFRRANVGAGVDMARVDAMAQMYRAGRTLEDIGAVFGVTRERVRQIIAKRTDLTAEKGGGSVRSLSRKLAKQRKNDERCLSKYGCTYEQYRSLVRKGKEIMANGEKRGRTPTGAYHSQRMNAILRGIEWNLTLWEWWQVWCDSGKWEERGRGKDRYVMCRFRDEGAYEVGNVYIATHSHNSSVQLSNPHRASKARPCADEARQAA